MNKNDPTDKFENELKKVDNNKKLKEYLSKLDKLEAGLYLQKLLDEKGKKVKVIGLYNNWAQLSSGYWVPLKVLKK